MVQDVFFVPQSSRSSGGTGESFSDSLGSYLSDEARCMDQDLEMTWKVSDILVYYWVAVKI